MLDITLIYMLILLIYGFVNVFVIVFSDILILTFSGNCFLRNKLINKIWLFESIKLGLNKMFLEKQFFMCEMYFNWKVL